MFKCCTQTRSLSSPTRIIHAVPLKSSKDPIDQLIPIAYRNKTWRYYLPKPGSGLVIFTNTRNGPQFVFNNTGKRINRPIAEDFHKFKTRKEYFHTWNAYMKRAVRDERIKAGAGARNAKYASIDERVRRMFRGENSLSNLPLSSLIWWAGRSNRMGRPYKKQGGKWMRINSNKVVTKNNVIQNIRLMYSNEIRNLQKIATIRALREKGLPNNMIEEILGRTGL